jgi:hypothetical protein
MPQDPLTKESKPQDLLIRGAGLHMFYYMYSPDLKLLSLQRPGLEILMLQRPDLKILLLQRVMA